MIIDNYRILKFSAREGVYKELSSGTIDYNCFEEEDVKNHSQILDGVKLMIERDVLGLNLNDSPGNYILELLDNDNNLVQCSLVIEKKEKGRVNVFKIITPSKVLNKLSDKDILINMILGQPISQEFADKCNALEATRGTNRYLKYKRLFMEIELGEYVWKNTTENHIARGILEKYSFTALEELYEDLIR